VLSAIKYEQLTLIFFRTLILPSRIRVCSCRGIGNGISRIIFTRPLVCSLFLNPQPSKGLHGISAWIIKRRFCRFLRDDSSNTLSWYSWILVGLKLKAKDALSNSRGEYFSLHRLVSLFLSVVWCTGFKENEGITSVGGCEVVIFFANWESICTGVGCKTPDGSSDNLPHLPYSLTTEGKT